MSAIAHSHSLADKLSYSRTLVQAGVTGFRTAKLADDRSREFASATRSALKAAAIAAGIGLLASSMGRNPKRAIRNAFAVGGITFCTDLCWHSRTATTSILEAVRKQVSSARDQHWLELNPIDYA